MPISFKVWTKEAFFKNAKRKGFPRYKMLVERKISCSCSIGVRGSGKSLPPPKCTYLSQVPDRSSLTPSTFRFSRRITGESSNRFVVVVVDFPVVVLVDFAVGVVVLVDVAVVDFVVVADFVVVVVVGVARLKNCELTSQR